MQQEMRAVRVLPAAPPARLAQALQTQSHTHGPSCSHWAWASPTDQRPSFNLGDVFELYVDDK